MLLVFSLSACQNQVIYSKNSSDIAATVQQSSFKKPDEYAAVLRIAMKPCANLYVDNEGAVVAVEPANEEAKKIVDEISNDYKNYLTVIREFIIIAKKQGFIADSAKFEIGISETKLLNVNAEDILSSAARTAQATADELKIVIEVILVNDVKANAANEGDTSLTSANSLNNAAFSSSSFNGNGGQSAKAHNHNYAKATCTEPKRCSCGATQGSPLGHGFENGICKRCGLKKASQIQYTVVYNSNGGWGTTGNSTHIYNEKRALSKNQFKRAGYRFLGWNTQANAKSAQFSDKQSVQNLTTKNNQVVTLYAVWKETATSPFDDCMPTSSSKGTAQYHQTAMDNLGQTHKDVAIFGSETGKNLNSETKSDERFVRGQFRRIKGVAYLRDLEKNDWATQLKLVILGDGEYIFKSAVFSQYSGGVAFDVDISGINVLYIGVSKAGNSVYNLGGHILVENLILER